MDVLNITNPSAPSLFASINLSPRSANSVAAKDWLIAIAVQAATKTDPGAVEFYNANGSLLKSVTVGAQPDMITFTPDGHFVLTANEGEPNDAYTVDPEGSVSIIDISGGVANPTVKTAGFQFVAFDPADEGHDTYKGVVKFWNRSDDTFEGPFYLFPRNVDAGLELLNTSGTFQNTPYIEIPLTSLKPGDKGEVQIEFKTAATPGPGQISFDAHVFAGSL